MIRFRINYDFYEREFIFIEYIKKVIQKHGLFGAHLVVNLVLEWPDHEEEVGAKHPHDDADDGVRNADVIGDESLSADKFEI